MSWGFCLRFSAFQNIEKLNSQDKDVGNYLTSGKNYNFVNK